MSFAFPAFLFGLFFIGLPIFLHLLRKRPREISNFPSFLLLNGSAARRQHRNDLRKWIILACRCAALTALALLFAWPFRSQEELKPACATVVILDGSFSATAPESFDQLEGELETELRQASPRTPIRLLLATDSVADSGKFTSSAAELRDFCRNMRKPKVGSDLYPALLRADRILGSTPAARRRIVVITDRQKAPWRHLPARSFLRGADEVQLSPATPEPVNAAVTDVKLSGVFSAPESRFSTLVKIRNFHTLPLNGEVEIELADRKVVSVPVELPPRRESALKIDFKTPSGVFKPLGGTVRLKIASDKIPADDLRYFTLHPALRGRIRFERGKRKLNFPLLALKAGSARTDDFTDSDPDKIGAGEILVLTGENGSCDPAGLEAAIRRGVHPILIWSDHPEQKKLFAHFGVTEKGKPADAELESIDFEHPILQEYLKLGSAAWFDLQFRKVPDLKVPSGTTVPVAFSGNRPALMELRRGGRILLSAFPVGREQSDFPVCGMFPAFWNELIRYAGRAEKEPEPRLTSSRKLKIGSVELDRSAPGVIPVENRLIAINVDPRESDPARLPESFSLDPLRAPQRGIDEEAALFSRLRQTGDYRTALLLILLLAGLTELFLSNRTVQ